MNKKKSMIKKSLLSLLIAVVCFSILGTIYFAFEQRQINQIDLSLSEESDKLDDIIARPNDHVTQTEEKPAELKNDEDVKVSQEEIINRRIYEKLDSMTLEAKVAQLFIVTPDALTGKTGVTIAGEITKQSLEQYPVCGLIYFSSNVVNPEQLRTMSMNLQSYAKEINDLPLFLSIDEEGGAVARIGNHKNFEEVTFPDMLQVGETGDVSLAFDVGKGVGSYLSSYNINLDFAPVADVLTNNKNTVIATRTFGSDPETVADMSMAVVKGLQEHNVYACMKHFPGHGSTEGDTHNGYAYTNKSIDELKQSELIPFQRGIDEDLSFIMVSHISVPEVVGDYTPASLSEVMMTDILRNDMGYNGIIITDAMNMGAIVNHYTSDEAAVKAIQSGADIILMPESFTLAYQGILEAMEKEDLTLERINHSVIRILKAKFSMMDN